MINIVEDTPSKISGLTSLFVSFDYNPEIVNIIKNASKYSFDKTTYLWELPITCLSYLLDNLTYIDDITLKLKNDVDNKNHFYPKLVAKYKSKPFKHQLEGIEFGLNTDNWLLLDEPGLGKTLQMIYLAEELKAQKGLEHCLIICGINALKANWEEEIHKHSNESVRILGKKVSKKGKVSYSTIKERAAEIMRPLTDFFLVVNIESIRHDEVINAIKKGPNKFGMIIIDEAHRCLAGNTLIETDGGLKSIAEIVENKLDCKVKSFNLKENKIEFKSIDDYYKSDFEEKVIELTILDEKNIPHSIVCTEDHPVYTKNRGYVLAKDVNDDDELIISMSISEVLKGKKQSTQTIEKLKYFVYNIGVEDNDNYFANGVLVHNCKNPNSQQGHNLLKLDAEHKIALTGTLIVNNPLDAYAALKWTGIEHSTLTNFKSQYCQFGGFGGYQIVGYKNIDLLKHMIENRSLRRTKKEIKDLPPKTIIPEILEMDDSHLKFYESVKEGVKEECDKIELKANNVLSLTTRLRQASTCPSILTSNNVVSTKIERAIELVDDIVANGDKVVIMSQFKEPLNILYAKLKKYNPLLGSGDVSDDEFNKNKKLFQDDPKYKVFLGTGSKAGTGITLNAASYMICLDMPFTAALQKQIEDRIHRVDNTKPVFIYRLICQGTIDEAIAKMVSTKEAISDFIVDDKADEKTIEILRNYIQDL